MVGALEEEAEAKAFSTNFARDDWSIPEPMTAILPLENADAAYDLISEAVMLLCGEANRDDPRPERKASAWATSIA